LSRHAIDQCDTAEFQVFPGMERYRPPPTAPAPASAASRTPDPPCT
jgi:hypothetical protein